MEDKIEYRERMKERTKGFALRVIGLYGTLSYQNAGGVLGKQLLRAATSVAANYRAACRARSGREFFAKISIAVEEADETLFWLELLSESGLVPVEKLAPLLQEALEILKLLATARKNTQV